MNSAISDIFEGEKYRIENISRSAEYKNLRKSVNKIYTHFIRLLNEEQSNLFEEFYNGLCGLEAEHSKTSFEEGFKLGLTVAFEAIK